MWEVLGIVIGMMIGAALALNILARSSALDRWLGPSANAVDAWWTELHAMRIRTGDRIVLSYRGELSAEQTQRVRNAWRAAFGPDVPMVVCSGCTVTAWRVAGAVLTEDERERVRRDASVDPGIMMEFGPIRRGAGWGRTPS